MSLLKAVYPRGRTNFDTKGHSFSILGIGPIDNATQQISKLYGLRFGTSIFKKNNLNNISVIIKNISPCKTYDAGARAILTFGALLEQTLST